MSIKKSTIEDAICEYIQRDNTSYAVLISGLWGGGKTYYWENELQIKIKEKGYKTLYVSLNGINKTEQIARKIVTTYWKNKTGGIISTESIEKHKSLFGEILTAISTIYKGISSLSDFANSLIKIDLKPENMIDYIDFDKVVVCFDDLERYSDIKGALGFINDFVEHKKVKAVILANEDKITENFSELKEKVVGKTIKFDLDNKEILNSIIQSYPENIRNFYLTDINLIVEMMKCSESCNYRVIRTILDDFYNIYNNKRDFDETTFLKVQKLLFKYTLAIGLEIRVKGLSLEEKGLIKEATESSYIQWALINHLNNKGEVKSEPYHILFRNKYYKKDFEGRYLFSSVFDYLDSGYLDMDKLKEEVLRYKEEEFTPLQYLSGIGYWKMNDEDFETKIKVALLKSIENGEVELALYPRLFILYAGFQQDGLINCSLQEMENKFYGGMKKIKETGKSDYREDDTPHENIPENLEEAYIKVKEFASDVRVSLVYAHYRNKSRRFIALLRKDVDEAVGLIDNAGVAGLEFNSIPIFQEAVVEEIYNILTKTSNSKIVNFRIMLINRYGYQNVKLKVDYIFIHQLSEYILMKKFQGELSLSGYLLKRMAIDINERCYQEK